MVCVKCGVIVCCCYKKILKFVKGYYGVCLCVFCVVKQVVIKVG